MGTDGPPHGEAERLDAKGFVAAGSLVAVASDDRTPKGTLRTGAVPVCSMRYRGEDGLARSRIER